MTINLTDVTFDLLVAEQLHDIVPCDWRQDHSCPQIAHWGLRCPKCGDTATLCSGHRSLLDQERSVVCDEGHEAYEFPLPLPWVAL